MPSIPRKSDITISSPQFVESCAIFAAIRSSEGYAIVRRTGSTNGYNNRLQPTLISGATPTTTLFSLGYGYGPANQNNGNPSTVVNNLIGASGRSQTFTYDALNRLSTAQSQATSGASCWGQSFSYDPWGNLQTISQTKCAPPMLNAAADNHNHMIGFNYDAAGNLTREGSGTPSWNYSWDAENRLSSISGSAADTFTYDGDGERVKKSNGALFWRQHGGPYLTKTNLAGGIISERILFNGLHVAILNHPTTVHYLFQDHLGGEHLVTDATGSSNCQDIDTLPFGSEIGYSTSCNSSYRFAGMDRDYEDSAKLDYAIGRYYDLRLGRFLSSDPIGIMKQKFVDPQQWNMYSYARNNPLRFTDPTGQYICNGNTDQCARIKTALETAQKGADKLKDSKEKSALEKAIKFYGKEGEKNGVTVKFGDLSKDGAVAETSSRSFFGFFKRTDITFDTKAMDRQLGAVDDAGTAAHEGAHGVDQWAAGGHNPTKRADVYQTELNGAHAEAYVAKGLDTLNAHGTWNGGWTDANNPDMEKAVQREAEAATEADCKNGGCN